MKPGQATTSPELLSAPLALDTGKRLLPGPHFRGMTDAFKYFERQEINQQMRTEFGKYLDNHFLCNHFVTITLRDRVDPVRKTKRPAGHATLNAAWRAFSQEARKLNAKVAPAGIRITEYQRRGVPHIHALTVNTVGLYGSERRLADFLWRKYGKARISRFRSKYGAAGYLGKYLAKDASVEITAFGRLWHFARFVPGDSDPGAQQHYRRE